MLSSEEVNTFLAVVRCGSLVQAAEIVYATQSTVSYRLQSLERRIGTPLVHRSRGAKRITLTAAGEKFVDIAERWKLLEEEAAQMRPRHDRYLAIGAVDAAAIHVLQPFMARLLGHSPRFRIHLESGRYWQLIPRVASGHLHAAFTFSPANHADLRSDVLCVYKIGVLRIPDPARPDATLRSLDDLDPGREVYVPYSADIDLWRESRKLSKSTSSVDKNHLLPALLRGAGTWAFVPEFMLETLCVQTGGSVLDLPDAWPPALVLYSIQKKLSSHLARKDQEALDDAMRVFGDATRADGIG